MARSFLQYPLESLFQAPSNITVLRALSELHAPISGRELARRASMSDRNCRLVLRRLLLIGLVLSEGASTFPQYRLNRKHRLVRQVLDPLFTDEHRFKDGLLTVISKSLKGRCRWAGIFGSVAEGTDSTESDLDLLILVDNAAQEKTILALLSELRVMLSEQWGATLAPLVLKRSEWTGKKAISSSTRRSVLAKHIRLLGNDLDSIWPRKS